MFENRINDLFSQPSAGGADFAVGPTATPQNILPMVSVENIYQSAAARARRDYELDRLFNPDYYGDHGSGI